MAKPLCCAASRSARWLWEKFEAFNLRRNEGPFKALVDAYSLHDSDAFVAALPRLVDDQCETLLLHELGEHRAGQWLEPGWSAMRLALSQRRTEMQVRAVRDHIADLEVTLPTLLARRGGCVAALLVRQLRWATGALVPLSDAGLRRVA